MTREDYVKKIMKAKAQLGTAGVIHRKDLQRYIRRLEKELRIYDSYHRGR
jgi:hypothetical protein